MPILGEFPVDDITLDLILHSLDGVYEVDEEGNHQLVGADMTLNQLLDFLSGYDESKLIHEGMMPDPMGWGIEVEMTSYPDPIYHEHDVIRALIHEIQRLRDEQE